LFSPLSQDISDWIEAPLPDIEAWDLWISGGPHKPGDEVMIDIDNVFLPGNFTFVLIDITGEPEVILEESRVIPFELAGDINGDVADWNLKLPERTPARYLLGFSVDFHGDERVYAKEIVVDELNFSMSLVNSSVLSGKDLRLVISNHGNTPIEYGWYRVDMLENGVWNEVDLGLGFPSIAQLLMPNATITQPVRLPELPQGHYRVVKTVSIDSVSRFAHRDESGVDSLYSQKLFLDFDVRGSGSLSLEYAIMLVITMGILVIKRTLDLNQT
jgi:Bacterial Ig-like domain